VFSRCMRLSVDSKMVFAMLSICFCLLIKTRKSLLMFKTRIAVVVKTKLAA
jgi:hypothetical protein